MKMFRRIVNAIQWKTINVVPLPGIYANRYRMRDGRMLLDPCPAILLQSRGGETRTVFATFERKHSAPVMGCPMGAGCGWWVLVLWLSVSA
jgi:hypothetical protein